MWQKFIAGSFLFMIVKSIRRIKIFLAHTYCLFLFVYYCKKYHTNENFSVANLLLFFLFIFVKIIIWMKIFLVQFYSLFLFLWLLKVWYEWKYLWSEFIACFFLVLLLKSIVGIIIFLVQFCWLFLFAYYCKKYHTNGNISFGKLLLVPFCLFMYKVSYEWKYLWCKFVASFFLFNTTKSIIRMKIFLAETYCLLLFVFYCKKYLTNESLSSANLLLVAFCLLFQKVSYEWKYVWRKFIACCSLFIIVKSVILMKIFLT